MAKEPILKDLTSQYSAQSTVNDNNAEIEAAFRNTVSRDGSTPNQMEADFDLNSNDLINARNVYVNGDLTVKGVNIFDNIGNNIVGEGNIFEVVNLFDGDGSTTDFTLTQQPISITNTHVWVNNVRQRRSTYSVSGTTISFSEAPSEGTANIMVEMKESVTYAAVGASTVQFENGDTLDQRKALWYFASRAAAVTWYASNSSYLNVGDQVQAENVTYEYDGVSTSVADMVGMRVYNPSFAAADSQNKMSFDLSALTADRSLVVPNSAGTLALVADIASAINAATTNMVEPEINTFVPDFYLSTAGASFSHSNRFGYYIALDSFVVWGVYMTTTISGSTTGTTPFQLDLSDLGTAGTGPFTPADRLNMGMTVFKGGAINQNNTRLATTAGSDKWSIYYDDPATPGGGTQTLTFADVDTGVSSIFWAVGFFKK